MTTAAMTKRQSYIPGYEYEETISDGSTGDTVKIPPIHPDSRISCTVIAGVGTGKIQYTTSIDAKVIAGTAVWQDWPLGEVTGTDSDSLVSPITGLRGVSISGDITIEVVA
jgi:hypothetical protein